MIGARASADDRADLTYCACFNDTSVEVILLRLPMVMRITGLPRSTIYKLISQNQIPAPITLATRAVARLQSEIETRAAARVYASAERDVAARGHSHRPARGLNPLCRVWAGARPGPQRPPPGTKAVLPTPGGIA